MTKPDRSTKSAIPNQDVSQPDAEHSGETRTGLGLIAAGRAIIEHAPDLALGQAPALDQIIESFEDVLSGRAAWRAGMKRHGKTPTHEAEEVIQ